MGASTTTDVDTDVPAAWVSAARPPAGCHPVPMTGSSTAPTLSADDLTIRPMLDAPDEYARIAAWRNQPHVREWWDPDDPPMTPQTAAAEYREDVCGRTPTRACIIEAGGIPVGFIQYYPWAAYQAELAATGLSVPPGAWGLDIFIGDADHIDRGIGSRAVRLLCDHLLRDQGATAVAFGTDRTNARALAAYARAGMVATVEYLDTDTRGGQRVRSILLVRGADAG